MPNASTHQGMGAIVHDSDVAFRVWAPNADAVAVTGTFNDWSEETAAMAPEDGGMWYAEVGGAKPGDEYRFLIHNGEMQLSRIDPYARAVTTSVGNGIVVDPTHEWEGGGFEARSWNELVIYEMHIGTFNRPDEETAGTFADAIQKLGHLKRLGVNAVQIMPAAEFAGDVSWGYNPAHIFAVESAYGGPDGFKAFIKAAHKSGIAVILDVVYNHPARVYIAGLSAGGSAAIIAATAYPDLFAAAGVHSGLPAGAAHNAASGFIAMKQGAPGDRPTVAMPTIVFHGDADTVVHPRNGRFLVARSLSAHPRLKKVERKGCSPGGRDYTTTTHRARSGKSCCEHWVVEGAGHAWSGGHPSGSYTDPAGPDASREMLRFFLRHRISVTQRRSATIPSH